MLGAMYFQMGAFNLVLSLIVFSKVFADRNQFRDCRLFSQLLIAVIAVNLLDTAGWMLDGKLTGSLSLITNLVDGLNLMVSAAVCWCWVQYVQYLAYDDAGVPGKKNLLSTAFFLITAAAMFVAIPTRLFYYIDANGLYCRSTGYAFVVISNLVQLCYSIVLCFVVRRRVKDVSKRRELFMIGLIILLPIAGTMLQAVVYGYSMIWTAMTIVILIVFIHIQNKRREREAVEQHKQLQLALQQAQYASKAKTDFLSNMSHDIRTPMNAIIGFTAIATSHMDEKEVLQDSLAKIMTSSNHLLNLINDVLDMSRIESGKMHLQSAPCHLPAVMHELVDMVQSQIMANQLELFVDTFHVRDEQILTDSMKLNQIFLNLIGNAIKFNKPGGVVSIRIEQKPSTSPDIGSYVFTVKDTGCGISPEDAAHIFEPFERGVQDNEKDSVEGTGLGLAIVKNIVDMMGGTISVSSELGKGSEFRVGLSFGLPTKEQTENQNEKLCGLRALVVDDDYDTCDSVTTMLTEIGMNAEWTLTGKEAVLKAKKASELMRGYAAYIIDWLMPDMNGIEVARRIRHVIGAETPIFILTAYDYSDLEKEAREAGVTAFCRKPMFMSELRQTLYDSMRPVSEEPKPEATDISFRGKRILLTEDHPLNREIAVRLLTDKGAQVEEAEDGQIAVEKFKLSRLGYYDLILMDIRMPNLNGYEAADAIRALNRADAQTVPIIAMTANAFDEDKKMALAHGMNAHLSKPIEPQKLFGTLARSFQKKEASSPRPKGGTL
ncbi:hybrid sensor histidine kinase/response regulator [Eubacterium barkeri]|uniref:Stage 0 sporulation protein A homolog n=1 Tax=Eubacterium barkeri TaxID=1528 RepID=A0A1H3F862_EUBBA|nr:response regulator [Eubacterium barkeri]SDX87162.1 Signal transduction histidine kinase [Eubacterium barkeri]